MNMKMPLLKCTEAVRWIILIIFFSSIVNVHAAVERNPPPYLLTEMKIVPFNQRTNSFLAEIKTDTDFSGWNEMNLSLFVTVEVSGQAGSYVSKRNVQIVAYEGRRVIVKRVGNLGVIDGSSGKYYIPVWLYGPFCQPITIKARITGQKGSVTLQRKLDFQCGE